MQVMCHPKYMQVPVLNWVEDVEMSTKSYSLLFGQSLSPQMNPQHHADAACVFLLTAVL